MSNLKYYPSVPIDENDTVTAPSTKRVLLYGWDADSLEKVRLSVNSDGTIKSDSPTSGFSTCFVDQSGSVTYVSMENKTETWMIVKVDSSSGTVLTYANVVNNPTYTNITTARTDREALTYNLPSVIF